MKEVPKIPTWTDLLIGAAAIIGIIYLFVKLIHLSQTW